MHLTSLFLSLAHNYNVTSFCSFHFHSLFITARLCLCINLKNENKLFTQYETLTVKKEHVYNLIRKEKHNIALTRLETFSVAVIGYTYLTIYTLYLYKKNVLSFLHTPIYSRESPPLIPCPSFV